MAHYKPSVMPGRTMVRLFSEVLEFEVSDELAERLKPSIVRSFVGLGDGAWRRFEARLAAMVRGHDRGSVDWAVRLFLAREKMS